MINTTPSPSILLTTLNARYHHAAMGLRYLRANLGDLKEQCLIKEYIIQSRPIDVVEELIALNPRIIGIGVYIWNIEESTKIVQLLKEIRPEITVIMGGPEVSYELESSEIVAAADYVITGWGDISFPLLCRQLLSGAIPINKVIKGEQPPLDQIVMPYDEYTQEDIANRTIYVESSRGCPFKCEFCLSALDKTAWPFDLDQFLAEMETLYNRGLRQFKFVDRTFNLKPETGRRILDFFLDKTEKYPENKLHLHFEVIPDHLPDQLKEAIVKFPEGTLQFELGLQTLDATTQKVISRRTNLEKAEENIRWLMTQSHAHLHVDLIAGLPGESLASFAVGFDRLWTWRPHEIQLGILKRLKGTPVIRHTHDYGMHFQPYAPYIVLKTDAVSFDQMQGFVRFARFWDLIANSGRFNHSLDAIMDARPSPYAAFKELSEYAFAQLGVTYKIALDRLFKLVFQWLYTVYPATQHALLLSNLTLDYERAGLKGNPFKTDAEVEQLLQSKVERVMQRQKRHSTAALQRSQQQ